MKNTILSALTFCAIFLSLFICYQQFAPQNQVITGAPPNGEPEADAPDTLDPYSWLRNWVRPPGPTKVALQVGHLHSDQLPDELQRIRTNTGASFDGYNEVDINQQIAEDTKTLLEQHGIVVEILPATIPERYFADAFVAIHADGSEDYDVHGFKASPPWRDFSGKSGKLNEAIIESYATATQLDWDPHITANMRGYYAFSFWRYTHSVHPMTPAAILETGFLTNYTDRQVIVEQPEIAAKGLANGILQFLKAEQYAIDR
jgi:N-acetylmuramoyl-L-alanine amidase